jgi:hypothetical protein
MQSCMHLTILEQDLPTFKINLVDKRTISVNTAKIKILSLALRKYKPLNVCLIEHFSSTF